MLSHVSNSCLHTHMEREKPFRFRSITCSSMVTCERGFSCLHLIKHGFRKNKRGRCIDRNIYWRTWSRRTWLRCLNFVAAKQGISSYFDKNFLGWWWHWELHRRYRSKFCKFARICLEFPHAMNDLLLFLAKRIRYKCSTILVCDVSIWHLMLWYVMFHQVFLFQYGMWCFNIV